MCIIQVKCYINYCTELHDKAFRERERERERDGEREIERERERERERGRTGRERRWR